MKSEIVITTRGPNREARAPHSTEETRYPSIVPVARSPACTSLRPSPSFMLLMITV